MKKKLLKHFVSIAAAIYVAGLLTVCSMAYIYYSGGHDTAYLEINNTALSITMGFVYLRACSAWQNTSTPAVVTTNNNQTDHIIQSGYYDEDWYGLYSPSGYLSNGRATKFEISFNMIGTSTDNNYRQSVIVHEIGHALCLDDNPSYKVGPINDSIMNYD
ncbi:MAG: hypothetical protein LBR54_02095, partial [Oscillospiraceae bacterium]|nr:hypothetical protein [Oscillospiraceae bacterium]